eukprot:scaffold1548_cov186-Pinguiococcus_pyrenoidosus.AAC.2
MSTMANDCHSAPVLGTSRGSVEMASTGSPRRLARSSSSFVSPKKSCSSSSAQSAAEACWV